MTTARTIDEAAVETKLTTLAKAVGLADYDVEFEGEVCIGGESVEVLAYYFHESSDIAVFTMNADFEAEAEVTTLISQRERDYLFQEGERIYLERRTEKQEAIRENYKDLLYRIERESQPIAVDAFSKWWLEEQR